MESQMVRDDHIIRVDGDVLEVFDARYHARPMTAKTKVWKFRVAEDEDRLVKAATDASDTKFSTFVRSGAVAEAHRVLADRRTFELDPDAWEELAELLERPARVPDGLAELFSKPIGL
jgi:uncharacterized protein (DUF1778 family)